MTILVVSACFPFFSMAGSGWGRFSQGSHIAKEGEKESKVVMM